ncbi:hypothetical protein [Shimia aestuarii]|uniref:Uncharacterized protein n=1 Tax=Shimia aestuarii TaxID=254406 RepID=A0A1I4RIF7_9RHOB|nr:hypothetical protein [Shimia aestuarii]SFM51826.1 hypothetical protein SAMN04488042_10887 [Shimia aestuarii]
MSRTGWHILSEGETLTLARRNRARLDVAARTELPDAGRLRIAHQVRQDMWRALQGLRGFSPVVQVRREAGQLHITAGGEIAGAFSREYVENMIRDVLEHPERRSRWIRYARRSGGQS